jgi:hypothetical protein
MDRLHDLVSRKLGNDPALARLSDEAEAGRQEPRPRTGQRVVLALEDAAEGDTEFADALQQVVEQLLAASNPSAGVSASEGGQAVGGNVDIRADHGSAAAFTMGDVTLGNPPVPGPGQR